jgi:cell surface protein SprA
MYSVPMSGVPGIIALRCTLSDDRALAVSCLTNKGFLGEFPWGVSIDSTILQRNVVVKLVRPRNLLSSGLPLPAWHLLLKNVYNTGFANIEHRDFQLRITYSRLGSPSTEVISGHNVLNLLGLDVLDQNGQTTSSGDGAFDFIVGKTIDAEHGDIIFPNLAPFSYGIQVGLQSHGIPLNDTSAYLIPMVYDTTQGVASAFARGVYTIAGRAVHY